MRSAISNSDQRWGNKLRAIKFSGVMVPERTGTPFRKTFWGRNGVPVVIRPPRQNAIAAEFRQMFAVKIGFAYSEIRRCLM